MQKSVVFENMATYDVALQRVDTQRDMLKFNLLDTVPFLHFTLSVRCHNEIKWSVDVVATTMIHRSVISTQGRTPSRARSTMS